MSSKRWLQEHFKDPYVKKAQEEGYVSRAAYKLIELNDKDRLIKPGMTVVDLGAAPGGWCQVALELVGKKGRVVAVDLLELSQISGVEFIQGDFTEDACFEQLVALLDRPVDLVMSDMAPNISGLKSVDQPRSVYLVELAADLAQKVLRPGGCFVAKAFQGQGVEQVLSTLKRQFRVVKQRKPKASRPRSPEIYLVAMDFKGYQS